MSRFELTIQLGNAAAQTGEDVAGILEVAARDLRLGETVGLLFDRNGNRVGAWALRNEEGEA